MVYIDGFSHAKITQNRHKNVVMKGVGDDIELLGLPDNTIRLVHNENIKYSPLNQPAMLQRNKDLLAI